MASMKEARQHIMARLFYYDHAGELNRELKKAIPSDKLKELHRKNAWHHLFIAGRQLALLAILPLIIYHYQHPLIQIPAMILQGFVIFGFTVLLHEAIHKCIFNRDPRGISMWLGQLYGTLSGLSCTQFKRWHMDHHNQLGSGSEDPKRAHLSPKRNARWYKLLYFSPALFPIYMIASGRAQKSYPKKLKRRILIERLFAVAFIVGIITWFWSISPIFALKAWIIPQFVVFPVAFSLNRLGQHYVINPDDVANWSTLIRPNPVWNFLFLFSSYHLEHHYYPGVPFYKLKALQKELDPFFEKRGVPSYSYTQLLKAWLLDNHKPHTRLDSENASGTVAVTTRA